MYDYDNREDFEDYGKHCWLLTPWKGYRSATIVGQTDKGYIVQPFWPNRIVPFGYNMIDPFGQNSIDHLVHLLL